MVAPGVTNRGSGIANTDAVTSLVGRFQKPLLHYFFRRRFSQETAEDCVQETFARISRLDLTTLQAPESYLFKIAHSVAVDKTRRARSRREDAHVDIGDFEFASEEPSQARVFEGKEALMLLEAVLAELPPKTREILLLNRMEGLTYTQLAARYHVSISAIEKHMSRALSHIRMRFKDA